MKMKNFEYQKKFQAIKSRTFSLVSINNVIYYIRDEKSSLIIFNLCKRKFMVKIKFKENDICIRSKRQKQ